MFACFSFVASTPADVDPHVAPRSPTQLLEPFQKCQMARLRAGRVCAYPFQETDEANSLALLRTRRERPCHRPATEQSDEVAPPHSITSSARASREGGTVRPAAFAAFRLIIRLYLVGACTGRSAGFSPLRIRST